MIDSETLAQRVLSLARNQSIMISTAESCTGGMVAANLTAIAGSSDVFERGFVTYSNYAKQEMLGVSAVTIQKFGAVSEETAREMADGALKNARADLAVSITGIAGPGGSDHKPEGRVCFGLASHNTSAISETIEFGALGRSNVRTAAALHALTLLNKHLDN